MNQTRKTSIKKNQHDILTRRINSTCVTFCNLYILSESHIEEEIRNEASGVHRIF